MRITEKYKKAKKIGHSLKLTTEREELYQQLNSNSYFWNSEIKEWEKISTEANPPTELIKVRIWADARVTKSMASELIEALAKKGLRVINCSKAYLCRPPEHLESRIYIDFVKNPDEELVLDLSKWDTPDNCDDSANDLTDNDHNCDEEITEILGISEEDNDQKINPVWEKDQEQDFDEDIPW